jgi:hypothetical protein
MEAAKMNIAGILALIVCWSMYRNARDGNGL